MVNFHLFSIEKGVETYKRFRKSNNLLQFSNSNLLKRYSKNWTIYDNIQDKKEAYIYTKNEAGIFEESS